MSEQKKLLSELTTLEPTDVQDALISGLRARPNATSIYGAKGLTADELKKQYDKYPEILRGRLNQVIDALVESLTVNENGITPIAEQIIVNVGGYTTDDGQDTLLHAIAEICSRAIENELNIDQALENSLGAIDIANEASETANEAKTQATSAVGIAYNASTIAEDAKNVSESAVSTAEEANGKANSANSFAESSQKIAEEAKDIAETAESTARIASSIAKGANQAKTFDTKSQMESYVKGLYGFYVGQELKAGSTIVMSCGGHIEEIEYGSIVCDFTLVATNANTDEQSTIFEETYAECTGEINGKYYSLYTVPFDLIVDDYFGSFYMYNGFDSSFFDEAIRFAAIERAKSDLDAYLLGKLTESIIPIGTNLYIRDVGVPDYWWDGGRAFELETQKVDFGDIDTALQEIIALQEELLIPDASEVSY